MGGGQSRPIFEVNWPDPGDGGQFARIEQSLMDRRILPRAGEPLSGGRQRAIRPRDAEKLILAIKNPPALFTVGNLLFGPDFG